MEMEFSLPLLCTTITIAFTFIIILFFYTYSNLLQSNKNFTSSSYPLIGNLIPLLVNLHRFHDWVTDMLSASPTNTIQVNGFLNMSHIICTSNPANIEHILRSNFSNYIKSCRLDFLHDLLGDGIFNVDGDLWYSQRKIASFEFNTKSLRSFIDSIVLSEISSRLFPLLSTAVQTRDTVDFQDVLRRFAFDNICKLSFGDDPFCLGTHFSSSSSFITAFDEAVEISVLRGVSPLQLIWKLKKILNIGSEKRLKQSIDLINQYVMKIIQSREEFHLQKEDLLSRFMSSDDKITPRDVYQKRKFLRDIITGFILAGKDTTSTALTWFFWLLSANRECENRIRTELNELQQVQPGVFSYEDLKNLNYLHAAISESLRLFPPVAINTRLTVKDDVLPDGTKVKAGWCADYSAYATGRMESVWGKDCREFRPERWLDKDGVFQGVDQFRFPVFHGGPRVCLGREMAYMQMKSIAAAVIYGFEIEAVDGGGDVEKMKNPPYVLSVNMKMKGGLQVRVKSRKG